MGFKYNCCKKEFMRLLISSNEEISCYNGPTPASFSLIFGLFKQTIKFIQQINVKKCHGHRVFGARIRTNNI